MSLKNRMVYDAHCCLVRDLSLQLEYRLESHSERKLLLEDIKMMASPLPLYVHILWGLLGVWDYRVAEQKAASLVSEKYVCGDGMNGNV